MRPTIADMELWARWLTTCWKSGDRLLFCNESEAASAMFAGLHGAYSRVTVWAVTGQDPGFTPCQCCTRRAAATA